VDLPSKEYNSFKFDRFKSQLLLLFVVYCDFEAMVRNDLVDDKNKPKGGYAKREVYSAAYFLHSNVEEIPSRYVVKRRKNENTRDDDISRWLALEFLNIADAFDQVSKVCEKITKIFNGNVEFHIFFLDFVE